MKSKDLLSYKLEDFEADTSTITGIDEIRTISISVNGRSLDLDDYLEEEEIHYTLRYRYIVENQLNGPFHTFGQ